MGWPLVTRGRFDEVARQRDDLRRELNRWQDIVAKQNWGHQIHDSLPVESAPEVQAEPMPEAQETEEEMQAEYRRENAYLATLARTRKSQLPNAIERVMASRLVQRAKNAVGKPVAAAEVPDDKKRAIAQRFEQLKAETIRSIH